MSLLPVEPARDGARDVERRDLHPVRPLTGLPAVAMWTLFAVLSLLAVTNVARGVRRAWQDDGDVDMQSRAAEYRSFRDGIYPNRKLAGPSAPKSVPYTVYPPYALPMFAPYFEPGGLLQGRVLVEVLSVGALVVIGLYGSRELRSAGPAMAAIGAVAGAAITGTIGALSAGQFSLVCVALVVQQILFLERHRSVAAGVCWSLAMIKPQIALAFAVLFVTERQWRGLLVGLVILAALSLLACVWTGVAPRAVVEFWLFRESMSFSQGVGTPGPGELARAAGLGSRTVQHIALVLFGCLLAGLWWATRRRRGRLPVLPLAGACAVAGELLFYHQFYDHVMLAPTLFALFAMAAESRSPPVIMLAAAMAISVWLPQRFLVMLPYDQLVRAAVWTTAGVTLLSRAVRRPPDRAGPTAAAADPA